MRAAACIFGILAAGLCLLGAAISFSLSALPGENARLLAMGHVSVAVALGGFLGSGLALGRPRLGSAILLACAVVAPWFVGPLWLVVPPLYIIAALLAFMSSTAQPRAVLVSPPAVARDEAVR